MSRLGAARTIRGVIWDMGGILHVSPFEVFPEVERRHGLPPGSLPRGPFDPDADPDFQALEAGTASEEEYFARVRRRLEAHGLTITADDVALWTRRNRQEVAALMQGLAGRYRQAILTNDATTWLGPGWWRDWELRDSFDAIVDAAEEGIRKPHPEAYRRAARALRLPPSACLFVDDLRVNLEGARAVGMRPFHFDVTDPTGSVARLRHLLLPTP